MGPVGSVVPEPAVQRLLHLRPRLATIPRLALFPECLSPGTVFACGEVVCRDPPKEQDAKRTRAALTALERRAHSDERIQEVASLIPDYQCPGVDRELQDKVREHEYLMLNVLLHFVTKFGDELGGEAALEVGVEPLVRGPELATDDANDALVLVDLELFPQAWHTLHVELLGLVVRQVKKLARPTGIAVGERHLFDDTVHFLHFDIVKLLAPLRHLIQDCFVHRDCALAGLLQGLNVWRGLAHCQGVAGLGLLHQLCRSPNHSIGLTDHLPYGGHRRAFQGGGSSTKLTSGPSFKLAAGLCKCGASVS
mmetsp:Transcript_45158/g.96431  ORF Transcript_45158/g.96431 Transcript_45158/m.96431 type:complete len:309 (+) Transcript_45158:2518-3444(+)